MRGADKIIVNSGFTKGVVEDAWPSLASHNKKGRVHDIGIVYPCVDTSSSPTRDTANPTNDKNEENPPWRSKTILLSINRFESKKNIPLAIHAFHALPPPLRSTTLLILAGGYDPRVPENVTYHSSLLTLCDALNLKSATHKNLISALNVPDDIQILFLLSVPSSLKTTLLASARLLLYTPTNEHFGIVPLEAMGSGVPVLATDTGGPLETVKEGVTGWLRSAQDVGEWTKVMRYVVEEMPEREWREMGQRGREWVEGEFSMGKMGARLGEEVERVVKGRRQSVLEVADLLSGMGMGVPVLLVVYVVLYRFLTS